MLGDHIVFCCSCTYFSCGGIDTVGIAWINQQDSRILSVLCHEDIVSLDVQAPGDTI